VSGSDPLVGVRKTKIGFYVANLEHSLKPDYDFEAACVGLEPEDIETELLINWKASSGVRIYPEFRREIHVATRELPYYENLPLAIGWDWGLEPACAICQVNPMGQLQIFPSFYPEAREFDGIYSFGERVADHLLRTYAAPYGKGLDELETFHVGDPAGRAQAQHSASGRQSREVRSCFEVLYHGLDISLGDGDDGRETERLPGWKWIVHAGEVSNLKRQDAVRARLKTLLGGGLPAFIIDPREEFIQTCFLGGYCRKVYSDGTIDPKPLKNHASHIVNAIEYLCTRLFARPAGREEGELEEDRQSRVEPFRSQSSSYHRY
jgi:hypothetical protein